MLTLGEELLLTALDADKGVIWRSKVMQYGLNAAGLADLLALGLITLRRDDGAFGVTPVEDADPTVIDDPLLAAVWKHVLGLREGDDHPDHCVRNWFEPSLHAYLKSLRARGVIDWEKPVEPKVRYGRFCLLDPAPAAAARARIDRVRTGDADADARDQDLAGIVYGIGLARIVYRGLHGRSRRTALAAATERQRFAVILPRVLPAIPEQQFTFDSSRDLKMAIALERAVAFDLHQSGMDGGGHHGGGGHH